MKALDEYLVIVFFCIITEDISFSGIFQKLVGHRNLASEVKQTALIPLHVIAELFIYLFSLLGC